MEKMFKSCLFIINRECNLNCPFCNVTKIGTKNAPFDDVVEALGTMAELSNFIIIMGGEPLMYDEIFKVIHILDELGADFTIVTNGTLLTDNNIKKLKKAGLNNITVSMDYFKGFNLEKIIKLNKYFDDVSVSLVYDSNMVGKLYDTVKSLSDSNIWSIISLYNYSVDKRKHYLMAEGDKNNIISEYQENDMVIDITKVVAYFDNLLIHNSKQYLQNIPNFYKTLDWHCSYPHRLVVNNDLSIMPCEDMGPGFPKLTVSQLKFFAKDPKFMEQFANDFERKVKLCKGCYISCYYDLDILTPLEISHKGGKNVKFGDSRMSLCIRSKNREIKIEEEHICWFCGNLIKISDSSERHCAKCGFKKCTHCGKCYCDANIEERELLVYVNQEYCCNEKRLSNINKKEFY
ncbi:hypothetical protein LCGC14_1335810, partial [marine sediment metagenome]